MFTLLQADYSEAAAAGIGTGGILFSLALYAFFTYCMYKLFLKAGVNNPWMAFIPILMYIPMLQLVKKPTWWVILMLIPLVNIIFGIIVLIRFAKAFGHGTGYAILLIFFGFIMIPIMAFGSDTYHPENLPDETGKAF